MTGFTKEKFNQLHREYWTTADYIVRNAAKIRQDGELLDKCICDLILTYNNLIIYGANEFEELDDRTKRGVQLTLGTARKRTAYCVKKLGASIEIPLGIFERIVSDVFDRSFDEVPSSFEKSESLGTNNDISRGAFGATTGTTMNQSPFKLTRFSTPIRNQEYRMNVVPGPSTRPASGRPADEIVVSRPDASQGNGRRADENSDNTPRTEGQAVSGGIVAGARPQDQTINATGNSSNLNQAQPQIQNILATQPTYTTAQIPHTTQDNLDARGQNMPFYQPFHLPTHQPLASPPFPQYYQQQQGPTQQQQNQFMSRANQMLEYQAQQLHQTMAMNETLLNELRSQRESYQQLINNQLTATTNNTQFIQSVNNTNRIRQEFREILKNIPDFDGEKEQDLNNLLHVADLAYATSNSLEEMNAFYLSMKLHLKGHAYRIIYSDPTTRTWDQIKDRLSREFAFLRPDKGLINRQLETARQLENESIEAFSKKIFAYANQKRAAYGTFTSEQESDLNEQMIRSFVSGLRADKIRSRLSLYSSEKYSAYISKALEIEKGADTDIAGREFYCNYCHRSGHREINCKSKQEKTTGLNQLSNLFGSLATGKYQRPPQTTNGQGSGTSTNQWQKRAEQGQGAQNGNARPNQGNGWRSGSQGASGRTTSAANCAHIEETACEHTQLDEGDAEFDDEDSEN